MKNSKIDLMKDLKGQLYLDFYNARSVSSNNRALKLAKKEAKKKRSYLEIIRNHYSIKKRGN